jgi:hypothetical protein
MRPSDTVADPEQVELLRAHARAALEAAGALGRFPTPVADVLDAAKLFVAEEALDEGFLAKFRRGTTRARALLKSAISKVLGVFDAKARLVYVDKTVLRVKQTFLKFHETAHALLPWQRDVYAVIEDCEKTLAPEVSDQFDREANAFASEVLFQLDGFTQEASDRSFGIRVPLELSKRYGASVYASVRRYVSKHHLMCTVLVLEPPVFAKGDGFRAKLRRVVSSPAFEERFGTVAWGDEFTPDDRVGAMIPIGKKRMSSPREIPVTDANGTVHECVAEAFSTTHHVFVLVHVVSAMTATSIVVP